jgi:peptide/nickel transport system substrate-binding protein
MSEAARKRAPALTLVLALLAIAGCASPAPQQSPAPGQPPAGSPLQTQNTPRGRIVIVTRDEPVSLDSRLYRSHEVQDMINAPIAYHDEADVVRPLLVEKMPSRDDGTWTIESDGHMVTTYTLKPDLKWQDGVPMTAPDFAFAASTYLDPDLPVLKRTPESYMQSVTVVNPQTVRILWREPYAGAASLAEDDLAPLPQHILQPIYLKGKEDYTQSSFFTSEEYVGSGAFKVKEWQKGISVILTANPYFVLGPPKLDTVEVKFLQDANTVVAGFLAGTVDFSSYTAINFEQALTLRDQWGSSNGGQILISERRGGRYVEFQYGDVPSHQTAITDKRVRAAVMHGIDKEAMAQAITGGFAPAADTFFGKKSALYPRLDQVITKYPYDTRRTESLLNEAGWRKGGDGLFRNAGGQTLDMPMWITAANESQAIIVSDDLKRAGFNASPVVIPRARNDDYEYRVSFPAAQIQTAGTPLLAESLNSSELPTPQNGFSGGNRGHYVNPDVDKLYTDLAITLDPRQRDDMMVELERIMTGEVAGGHLYYLSEVAARRSALKGPKEFASPNASYYSFNIWDWEVS